MRIAYVDGESWLRSLLNTHTRLGLSLECCRSWLDRRGQSWAPCKRPVFVFFIVQVHRIHHAGQGGCRRGRWLRFFLRRRGRCLVVQSRVCGRTSQRRPQWAQRIFNSLQLCSLPAVLLSSGAASGGRAWRGRSTSRRDRSGLVVRWRCCVKSAACCVSERRCGCCTGLGLLVYLGHLRRRRPRGYVCVSSQSKSYICSLHMMRTTPRGAPIVKIHCTVESGSELAAFAEGNSCRRARLSRGVALPRTNAT